MEREKIEKALELHSEMKPCVDKCPYGGHNYCGCDMAKDALSLIKSQEQKIFELENRLKECENGYEGTLFLDRCKLHDAEEKVKKLTEENERLREENNRLVVSEVSEVTIGLERIIRVRNEHPVVMAIRADTVRKMQSLIERRSNMCGKMSNGIVTNRVYHLTEGDLDQIVKEILGEREGE